MDSLKSHRATPGPGHDIEKWQKHVKNHILESQEVSPFPTGDHKSIFQLYWAEHLFILLN